MKFGENMMEGLYDDICEIYDDLGISDYAITFGKSILEFFSKEHPDKEFKRHLDICSGTGALCNFFYEKGIETKGVDIMESMVVVAKNNFPAIEFICEDAAKYKTDETFDFITSTDDALNHVIDLEDFKSIIENVSSMLREGGYFFFDLNLERLFEKESVKEIGENKKFILSRNLTDDGILEIILKYYVNDELIVENEIQERVFDTAWVIKVLNDNGFILERCSQEFYQELRADKLKFIARKGEKGIFSSPSLLGSN